jgi:2-dehydropantoate 2-reductase
MKPSLLVDLVRGGPTEIDILSGAIAELGRRLGIETPVHDAAITAVLAATGGP